MGSGDFKLVMLHKVFCQFLHSSVVIRKYIQFEQNVLHDGIAGGEVVIGQVVEHAAILFAMGDEAIGFRIADIAKTSVKSFYDIGVFGFG